MIMRAAEAGLATTKRTLFVAALMLAVAAATASLTPAPTPAPTSPDLEARLPEDFAQWRRVALSDAVLPKELELGPGEAIAYRAYADEAGRIITLVAAYGPPLGDSVRLHRPESCYVAQGFEITARSTRTLALGTVEATIVRLSAASSSRREAVTYWLRSGSAFVTNAQSVQFQSLGVGRRRGLDGALIRVSSPGADPLLFELQSRFLTEFAAALTPEARALFLGDATGPGA